ncbi:Os06g0664000, partial [Oryza sativa Japonica Group]
FAFRSSFCLSSLLYSTRRRTSGEPRRARPVHGNRCSHAGLTSALLPAAPRLLVRRRGFQATGEPPPAAPESAGQLGDPTAATKKGTVEYRCNLGFRISIRNWCCL